MLTRSGFAGAAACAVLLPLIVSTPYVLGIAISALTFMVLATSLNLVYGYGGLLSFGQAAFFGLGAYTSAILVVDAQWNFWLATLAGAALATVLGIVVGFASLRLSRNAFVIVSLAMTIILQLVAKDWSSVTRGPAGLPGLPAPGIGSLEFDSTRSYYWFSLGVTCALLLLVHAVVHSPAGRIFAAIRLNEPLAKSQGINPMPYRLVAIGLSAFVAGAIGAVHAFNLTVIDPSVFDFYYAEVMLIMVLLGGPGRFWGVIVAAIVFSAVPELLRVGNDARALIYGFILMALMLFLPDGFAGLARRLGLGRAADSVDAAAELKGKTP
ncbi:branched-chain amino acid ABC transporter permease [Variovorax sp. M-6]|uniref:branched-chain amino acid ABC transporter permease n=1 Tax=Variovorax sp. M-6 TaxID=3233041 RepID=UPI003F9B940B